MHRQSVGFIGGGNMGFAICRGLIKNGWPVSNIAVSEPNDDARARFNELGIDQVFSDNHKLTQVANNVVLAIKPQLMQTVLSAIAKDLPAKRLFISIAAGTTCATIEKYLTGDNAIIRAMPNTPALIGQGVSGLFANSKVNDEHKTQAEKVLGAVGKTVWVEKESQLDVVTAISGSGPAYFFLLIEALQKAAKKYGLSDPIAKTLTLQTAVGAALLAAEENVSVTELRRRVTSPGGTTEAAVSMLEDREFAKLVDSAVNAAIEKAKELSKPNSS